MEENTSVCAVCGQTATLKCSACKNVSYCCKEHQKKDWKTHRNSCKPFEIKDSPVIGRHLVAVRDIPEGAIIINELPLVVGPKTHSDLDGENLPCVGCYRPISAKNPPGRCLQCGWPTCGTHCPYLKHIKEHGTECPVLKLRKSFAVNNLEEFYRTYALTPLRCLLLQKRDPKKWKQVMEMETHIEKRGPETEIHKIIEENVVTYLYSNFICPLKEFEQENKVDILKDCSKETIHKICGILDVNSQDIHLSGGSDITGLYPTAYLLEHNCVPNTKHVFDLSDDSARRFRIIVKAARLIKKGEHITTMYTHALWGTQARRDHLNDTKYFICHCDRCKDPTEFGTYLSALKCMGGSEIEPCDGYQLPIDPLNPNSDWICNKCSTKIEADAAIFLTAQLGDDVEAIQDRGPTVRELESLLEKLTKLLHPNHYHIYTVKHSLMQLYGYQQGYLSKQMNEEQLKRKINMCQQIIEITNKIDPHGCRLALYQAVSYHELHLAQFELIKRKWSDLCFEKDREPYRDQLKQCRELIEKAKVLLKDEPTGSAGHRLVTEIFSESKKSLEKWIDDMRVAI